MILSVRSLQEAADWTHRNDPVSLSESFWFNSEIMEKKVIINIVLGKICTCLRYISKLFWLTSIFAYLQYQILSKYVGKCGYSGLKFNDARKQSMACTWTDFRETHLWLIGLHVVIKYTRPSIGREVWKYQVEIHLPPSVKCGFYCRDFNEIYSYLLATHAYFQYCISGNL